MRSICIVCDERDGEVWFCGEGSVCESCFRKLGAVPDEVDLEFDAKLTLTESMSPYISRAAHHIEHRE
jgi:hypothetical protein